MHFRKENRKFARTALDFPGKTLNETLRISGNNFMNGRFGREGSRGGRRRGALTIGRTPTLSYSLSLSIMQSLSLLIHPLTLLCSVRDPILFSRRLCAHVRAYVRIYSAMQTGCS